MISSALKNFANETNLKVIDGSVCGNVNGYLVTVNEDPGYKSMFISLIINDNQIIDTVNNVLLTKETRKKFKITNVNITLSSILIFFANSGSVAETMKEFKEWFFPLLKNTGAAGEECCAICKKPFDFQDKSYKMMNRNVIAVHNSCINRLLNEEDRQIQEEEALNGNYLKGTVGAVLGGLIGAIPWAVVYSLGWFVGWLGFLIGIAAKKGYTLFGGRIKKPTIFILIISVIIGVVFGQFLGDCIDLLTSGYAFSELPALFSFLFTDSGYVSSFLLNVVIGLVFAGIGAAGVLKNVSESASKKKIDIIDLDISK